MRVPLSGESNMYINSLGDAHSPIVESIDMQYHSLTKHRNVFCFCIYSIEKCFHLLDNIKSNQNVSRRPTSLDSLSNVRSSRSPSSVQEPNLSMHVCSSKGKWVMSMEQVLR